MTKSAPPPRQLEFVFRATHLVWTVVAALVVLGFKLFAGGVYVSQTYPTVVDLKAIIDTNEKRFLEERNYEKEQHETLTKELHSYSDNNHSDMLMRLNNTLADQKVMTVKLDQANESLKELKEQISSLKSNKKF